MTTDREALRDLLGAVERMREAGYRRSASLRAAIARTERHLDRPVETAEPVAPVGADPRYLDGWRAGVEYGRHLAAVDADRRERAAYAAGMAAGAEAHP